MSTLTEAQQQEATEIDALLAEHIEIENQRRQMSPKLEQYARLKERAAELLDEACARFDRLCAEMGLA